MFFYTNPILIAAAVVPAILLLRYIYRKDALEKEPPRLLISLVARGIIATFLAMIAEGAGEWILGSFVPKGTIAYNALLYFGVVAFSEEGFKYMMLRHRTWKSPEFNCSFDGVVYAVFVSLGFALWENISYVSVYGLGTAAVRALTAVPGHACFGVFMGSWYGMARWHENYGDHERSKQYCRKALLAPALLHGCYDFIATINNSLFAVIFLVFIVIVFSSARRTVMRLSEDDRYIDGNGYFRQ